MKDPIQDIEERSKFSNCTCDQGTQGYIDTLVSDIKNLLNLVKAYEEIARELVNSDGVVSVDQEQQTVTVMCLDAQDKIFGKDRNE